jgi:hypothetical protein
MRAGSCTGGVWNVGLRVVQTVGGARSQFVECAGALVVVECAPVREHAHGAGSVCAVPAAVARSCECPGCQSCGCAGVT